MGCRVLVPDLLSDGRLNMGSSAVISLGLKAEYGLNGG